ncbi:MAG: manganese efflux pump [Firmicutes bacterium]|nr:manganese efflux pump [Bacillota bacterium]
MWIAIFSGLLVSVDALFIGISFGSQKKCRFWHLVSINMVLIALCFLGYGLGVWIGDKVDVELDFVIGTLFISLGSATILHFLFFERKNLKKKMNDKNSDKDSDKGKDKDNSENDDRQEQNCSVIKIKSDTGSVDKNNLPTKNTIATGILMSVEAMFITIGLTLVLDKTTILIPLTVGLAHFIYCTVSFFLAKHLRRLSPAVGPIVAGIALIIYGTMAFFL